MWIPESNSSRDAKSVHLGACQAAPIYLENGHSNFCYYTSMKLHTQKDTKDAPDDWNTKSSAHARHRKGIALSTLQFTQFPQPPRAGASCLSPSELSSPRSAGMYWVTTDTLAVRKNPKACDGGKKSGDLTSGIPTGKKKRTVCSRRLRKRLRSLIWQE